MSWVALPPGEIHVWLLRRPPAMTPGLRALTTGEEQLRAVSMASQRRQCEWLAGRALLRHCLAAYTGSPPRSLRFGQTSAGKPVLALPGAPAFNLSHGPDWLGCAVAQGCALGLDLECQARRNDTDGIAARYFHPQEQAALAAAADERMRKQVFFRSWTLKEAYIKARGDTLNGARLHELGFSADGKPLFHAGQGHWQFFHTTFDRHHHLALACHWRECDTVNAVLPRCRFWLCEPDLLAQRELTDLDRL